MSIRVGIMGPVGIGGGGVTPTLQQVTTSGNTTSNDIIWGVGGGPTITRKGSGVADVWTTSGGRTITHQREGNTSTAVQQWPEAAGIFQVSGNGLLLPVQAAASPSTFTVSRFDHVIECDMTAGGAMIVSLPTSLYLFPGLQVVVKVVAFGGVTPTLHLHPVTGKIEGVVDLSLLVRQLFAIRIVNDGTNWWILDSYEISTIVTGIPTITPTANAGVGASSSIVAGGTDLAGKILTQTGAGAVTGDLFTFAFSAPFTAAPRAVSLTWGSAPSGTVGTQQYVPHGSVTVNGFVIHTAGIPGSNFTYNWWYNVIL